MPRPTVARRSLFPTYLDGRNVPRKGKPDYLRKQARTNTFIEWKFGRLDRHLSQDNSHDALQAEYGRHRQQSHAFLSDHFWFNGYQSGKVVCLEHGHNHSLYKVLALQALHGWWNYIVIFYLPPKPEDARAYCEAGLIWATVARAQRLLACIDMNAHGVLFPFYLRTMKYTVIVQPGPESSTGARRAVYEAAVAGDTAARHASASAAAADIAAGRMPF